MSLEIFNRKKKCHLIIICIHFDNHWSTLLCTNINQMPFSFTFKGTSLQQFPPLVFVFSLAAGSLHRKTPAPSYFRVCLSRRKLPYPIKHVLLPVGTHPKTNCARLLIRGCLSPMQDTPDTPIMFVVLYRTAQDFFEPATQFKCITVQIHPLLHLAFFLHRCESLINIQNAKVHLSVYLCKTPCCGVLVKVTIWSSRC